MATELSSFAELKKAPVAGVQAPAPVREKEVDKQGRSYATGRRKNAVARVWVKLGTGKITINGRDQEIYFARPTLRLVINQPFGVAEREGERGVQQFLHGWQGLEFAQKRLSMPTVTVVPCIRNVSNWSATPR